MTEIRFVGKRPIITDVFKIGNVGEKNVNQVKFVFNKLQGNLDLSEFDIYIEWIRVAGGADFSTTIETEVGEEQIGIIWNIGEDVLETPSKIYARVVFEDTDKNKVFISDDVPFLVSRLSSVDRNLEATYPLNYKTLWDNVDFIRDAIAGEALKGEKGERGLTGGIVLPVMTINEDMELIISDLAEARTVQFAIDDGILTMEVL